MTGRGSFKAFAAETKARTDLVEVIGGDVELRRAGNTLKGLSPFHAEKHASFVVWPATQTWHDYSNGGGLGGDVFTYVQEREKVGFKEAVFLLAERAGIRRWNQDDSTWKRELATATERREVERLMGTAASYYHRRLPDKIRDRLWKQHYGFTDETIDRLRLGWADGHLFDHLIAESGGDRSQALKTGLFVVLAGGRVVDLFRNRLVFPYWRGGRVVYFTARRTEYTSDEAWEEPKYKKLLTHSDEHSYVSPTVRNDFFFNEDAARGADELVITEGTPDCISAMQAGVACISTSTTSFRGQDLPRLLELSRHAKRIIICNDAEKSGAGEIAAAALAAALWNQSREVCIATIPRPDGIEKIDVNELVIAHGPQALRAVLSEAKSYPDYLLDRIPADVPKPDLDRLLEPVLLSLTGCSPIRADVVLDAITAKLGVRRKALTSRMKALGSQSDGSTAAATRPPGDRRAETRVERDHETPAASTPAPGKRGDSGGEATALVLPRSRPRILIHTLEHLVVEEAIAALADVEGVFRRGPVLVHVVKDDSPLAGIIHPGGGRRIFALGPAGLREQLTRAAEWVSLKETKGGDVIEVPAHPPTWVVPEIEARKHWDQIRYLSGVVDSPVLRPDGTLLERAGYDAATGLLYAPNAGYPAAPATPTQHDAAAAAAELLDVVVDFPFKSDAHRAAWVAGVLTPLARYAFSGPSPLFLIDANIRSAGKTLLADATGEIVSGRAMPRTPQAPDENEEIKRITAIALDGTRLVLLDNINRPLGSGALDAVLTGTTWSERILGKSEKVELPLMTVWYATVNNVVFKGDTARRCLHIRLDSDLEKPEYRENFKHPNLLAWVSENRPRLVMAALTILRAYCAAGKPTMAFKPWGSFDGWSRLVRSAIVWAGLADPGETRAELDEVDTDNNVLVDLLAGWEELPNGWGLVGCTVARVLEALREDIGDRRYPRLRAALGELCPHPPGQLPTARKVAAALRRFRGRVVEGRKLQIRVLDGNNLWLVQRVGDQAPARAAAAQLSLIDSATPISG